MVSREMLFSAMPKAPMYRYDWETVENLPEMQAWIRRMRDVPQDTLRQKDGSVWTHTRRACDALAQSSAFQSLSDAMQVAVALGALFQHIGKVSRGRDLAVASEAADSGDVGGRLTRMILWRDYDLCGTPSHQQLREAVCAYVKWHAVPLFPLLSERKIRRIAAIGQAAPLFSLRGLCALAQADIQGNITDDQKERQSAAERFHEAARDAGCIDFPYPFPSAHTAKVYLQEENGWQDEETYIPEWGSVILLCALPGTGKDMWIQDHYHGMPVVSPDAWPWRRDTENAGVLQSETALGYLRAHRSFVWKTHSLPKYRSAQVSLISSYGAGVRIVFLETSYSENLRRNREKVDGVPESVMDRMLMRMEPPMPWEAERVDWVCV